MLIVIVQHMATGDSSNYLAQGVVLSAYLEFIKELHSKFSKAVEECFKTINFEFFLIRRKVQTKLYSKEIQF